MKIIPLAAFGVICGVALATLTAPNTPKTSAPRKPRPTIDTADAQPPQTPRDDRLVGHLKALGGSGFALVWRDKASHDEGISLIRAGVHESDPSMVMGLLSCMPTAGARAIVTDGGWVTHDILVIEGPDKGCRGNVAMESFKLD